MNIAVYPPAPRSDDVTRVQWKTWLRLPVLWLKQWIEPLISLQYHTTILVYEYLLTLFNSNKSTVVLSQTNFECNPLIHHCMNLWSPSPAAAALQCGSASGPASRRQPPRHRLILLRHCPYITTHLYTWQHISCSKLHDTVYVTAVNSGSPIILRTSATNQIKRFSTRYTNNRITKVLNSLSYKQYSLNTTWLTYFSSASSSPLEASSSSMSIAGFLTGAAILSRLPRGPRASGLPAFTSATFNTTSTWWAAAYLYYSINVPDWHACAWLALRPYRGASWRVPVRRGRRGHWPEMTWHYNQQCSVSTG